MAEALPPTTRLSATEDAEGWIKRTVSPLPMPKLCQLMAALFVVWLMVVVAPLAAYLPNAAMPG